MALATVEDVEARFYRPLEEDERRVAETRLNDAENRLIRRIPDLLEKAAEDPQYEEIVVSIEVDMVLRIIKNPEGYSQETDGNYSYSISYAAGSGILEVLPSEWALLGLGSGAFTIGPRIRPRKRPCYPWEF